jgi:pyridoxamine 5'-phosphate oxidase
VTATDNVSVSNHAKPLREDDVADDPLRQFEAWRADAEAAGVRETTAAALATAAADGAPSVRMVLVKSFDERGFEFFSNYTSRKGRELAENPRAALLFHWDPLGRQVRIEGAVARTSAEETAAYVRSRPRASQLSALASPQSETLADRATLERSVGELERRYSARELPLPEHWGGYRLTAQTIEFWQQREDRLHDRLRYSRAGSGWLIERLAP